MQVPKSKFNNAYIKNLLHQCLFPTNLKWSKKKKLYKKSYAIWKHYILIQNINKYGYC